MGTVTDREAANAMTAVLDALAGSVADKVTAAVLARLDAPRVPPAAFRLPDAADYLAVSLATLRRLIDRGDIEPVRLGSRVTIPRERLDALLRSAPPAEATT